MPHQGNASWPSMWPLADILRLLKIAAARAGVIVMALTAEMIIDAAIVSANCR